MIKSVAGLRPIAYPECSMCQIYIVVFESLAVGSLLEDALCLSDRIYFPTMKHILNVIVRDTIQKNIFSIH